jgi:hypothetical protein
MESQGALFANTQDIVLMLIVLVAFISGVHSLVVLYKLRHQDAGVSKDIKFLLATFNVLISMVSMCAVFVILQLDVNSIVKQAGELLAQLNK